MSLFAADGTMLHCSAKSKLMDILEKMFSAETSHVAPPGIPQLNKCFAITDTMADVHQWTKLAGLRRAMICQLISLHLYKEKMMNMMNYVLCLTGMTFQNHLSHQQGICGLVILTLWHSIAQHRHYKYFKCSTEDTKLSHTATKDELTVFCQKNCWNSQKLLHGKIKQRHQLGMGCKPSQQK